MGLGAVVVGVDALGGLLGTTGGDSEVCNDVRDGGETGETLGVDAAAGGATGDGLG